MTSNNQIVIGERGRAVQRQLVAWGFITYGTVSVLVGLFIGFYMNGSNTGINFVFALAGLGAYTAMGGLIIYAGIIGLASAKTNNQILDKEVLVYDPYQDVFIGYDCHKHNKEVIIKNSSIIDVRGSAFYNSRELIVIYKDEQGKQKRVSLGFCSNISRFAFRKKLNQYHTTKYKKELSIYGRK